MGTSINEALAGPGSVLFKRPTAPRSRMIGEITIRGAGSDVGGTADGCYFLHQTLRGDFQITVRALTRPGPPPRSSAPTNAWAKAGLMIRESLDPGARNASLFATTAHGLLYQWRPTANDVTESKAVVGHAGLKLPILLRITRRGNTLTSDYSTDSGRSFHPAGEPVSFDPPLARTIYGGLVPIRFR
jgi:hypothetical protein